jgi:hypothetical protein
MRWAARTSAWALVFVALLGAAGSVAVFLPRLADNLRAVPFQSMWVWFEDEAGVATIRSDAFRVTFPGHAFGTTKGGNHVVDGRYAWRLFHGPDGAASDVGNGAHVIYSQRERLLTSTARF